MTQMIGHFRGFAKCSRGKNRDVSLTLLVTADDVIE
jgi:hypothetical protein